MGVEEKQGVVRRLKAPAFFLFFRSFVWCGYVNVVAACVPFPCVGGRPAARFPIRCSGGGRRTRRQRRRCRGVCSRRRRRRPWRRKQRLLWRRRQAAPHAVTAACRTRFWLGAVRPFAEEGIASVVRRASGEEEKCRLPRGGCHPTIRAAAAPGTVKRRHPQKGCRPAIRAAAASASEGRSCASAAATPTGRCCGS